MKKKFVFIFAMLILFACVINTECLAVFEIEDFTIDANVLSNGNMTVIETINYYTTETVNGVTRDISIKNPQNTKNSADNLVLHSVMVDGIICEKIGVGTGVVGDNYVYEYDVSNNDFNIKLYTPFESSTKTVKYMYTLENVAVKYNDIGEIYWNFIGNEWDCSINNLSINITLPLSAATETSYVFGHGSDNGTFEKNGNYINLYAKNINAFQAIDARILFSKNAISDTSKIVNKNVLKKYINEEEGLSKERESAINKSSVKRISLIFVGIIIFTFVYMYIKYDKEQKVEKTKYIRELPFGIEPEILQYFYYGKTISNSYYIAVLNLIKMGVYRLENSINKVGKEVQKIIYNKNCNIKLKPYQNDIVSTINGYMYKDQSGVESIDLLTLGSKMSNSTGSGYKRFVNNMKEEKEALVGKVEKAPKKTKRIPIILFLVLIGIVIYIGMVNGDQEMFMVSFMMGFLALVYTPFFINAGNSIFTIIFLLFHCGCFQSVLILMMITTNVGYMYIPYLLCFILNIYIHRIEKFSKEERQIIEQVKGLRRYIKDFSMLKDKEEIDYINLWEDYFIMAIALKLNTKTINYFYNYGKEQTTSNLGASIYYTNSYSDLHKNMYSSLYNYQIAYNVTNRARSSSYSGSSGGFSGGSSSGGGGGRRRRRKSFLKMYKKFSFVKNKNMKKKIFGNICVGLLAGFVSGFFGAGGGMILVPYLTLILKEDEVVARATTILCIFFMVFTSSFFYFNKDSIDWILALNCSIGGIIGSYIGSNLLVNLDKKILKISFIIFLIYAGLKMIF